MKSISFRNVFVFSVATYGFGFFVCSGEFFSLVLKTAQLDFELVKTAG